MKKESLVIKLLAEQHENTCRLDFTPSEAVEMGRKIEPFEREAAKERQGKRTDLQHGANLAQSCEKKRTKSRDKIAQTIGMKRTSYRKAKKVVEFAEDNLDCRLLKYHQ